MYTLANFNFWQETNYVQKVHKRLSLDQQMETNASLYMHCKFVSGQYQI